MIVLRRRSMMLVFGNGHRRRLWSAMRGCHPGGWDEAEQQGEEERGPEHAER